MVGVHGLTVCEVVYYGIFYMWNTRDVIFVVNFSSHLNVCNVLSLLLECCRVMTLPGSLENTVPCLFSCWSWMAWACPWKLGRSTETTANGEGTSCLATGKVLSLERCWGDECSPGRSDHFEPRRGVCKDAGFGSMDGSHHLPAA